MNTHHMHMNRDTDSSWHLHIFMVHSNANCTEYSSNIHLRADSLHIQAWFI